MHAAHVEPAAGAPVEDNYILYADYDNPEQDRAVEYKFYTDFYAANVKMADNAK